MQNQKQVRTRFGVKVTSLYWKILCGRVPTSRPAMTSPSKAHASASYPLASEFKPRLLSRPNVNLLLSDI